MRILSRLQERHHAVVSPSALGGRRRRDLPGIRVDTRAGEDLRGPVKLEIRDAVGPARGIALGLALGALCWALLIAQV